ncbi:3-phenylpropionate/cinnamic acid dioxygenase subunit beta [Citrobacter freundii]|uniref:3-phenylpropionate/cinnamic acid dioxygenase subunit beta n=1 Tax=Citrobacter freundii TaxID=546 RepID=UPI0005CC9B8D|nr:3-phenylpropionate/cinnamic acid dioxygenase subunit beta [Citrobacter freundii]EIX7374682.1 3-phenylpropionate/cinnamic acid dioxygenase subunit beta [Citrobacter freundii]EKU2553815.1 3-phenylpropionate/cinnamic acid dioxygenase subunit beta [Citrobacter freundii]KJC04199.1 3-phenylpropionate dioxygenase [Citrobacter freundii]MBM7196813.1 3-phenylpropionate/cinnamic acid dioxygenase subunit beta [Citrobacter freundii]MBM7199187.1 3-phenylpropionate/cinnamic acid dioxygenase subunit beta [
MSTLVSLELHHRISQFLYEEAHMLDDWQFRDWLAQLDDDIRYTMRTTVNAQTRDRRKGVQPPTTWIFNDNKDQLERRIARLETGMAWAEEPPSRTRHLISNLQISETNVPDVFAVRLNYLLYRSQKERDETFYVGTRVDKVRRLPGDEWRLLAREIVLDQAVITSHNLSVLF